MSLDLDLEWVFNLGEASAQIDALRRKAANAEPKASSTLKALADDLEAVLAEIEKEVRTVSPKFGRKEAA